MFFFKKKVVHNILNTCRQMYFHIECRLVSVVAGKPEFQFWVRSMFTKKEIWFFGWKARMWFLHAFFVMFFFFYNAFSKEPVWNRLKLLWLELFSSWVFCLAFIGNKAGSVQHSLMSWSFNNRWFVSKTRIFSLNNSH